jgi:hypothetical protein
MKEVTMKSRLRSQTKTGSATIPQIRQAIRKRADYSLAVLGMAFVRNGSGQFLNIRSESKARRAARVLAE